MSSKIQIISVISFLSYSIIIGAFVFSRGFLLNRQVITDKAGPCLDTRYRHHYHHQNEESQDSKESLLKGSSETPKQQQKELLSNLTEAASWCQQSPPLFKKAILILVDALRYDFVGRMPFLSEVVRKQKEAQEKIENGKGKYGKGRRGGGGEDQGNKMSSCLFRFVADPPTTTMQRLKAVMTGTMPTFIDASANFNSYEVEEDSLIHQLHSSGKKLAFLGDDTWLSLFPEKYFTSPFVETHPSFNAWDLDTVDRAVNYTLRNKIFIGNKRHYKDNESNDNSSNNYPYHHHSNSNDWDVLIAHLLGVDHCGHRYGPSHPEMKRKLNEADSVIQFVFNSMSEDTLLVVFGDHGMTSTGDHGGDSRDETDSAVLFITKPRDGDNSGSISSTSSIAFQCPSNSPGISQIDLVPTLATFLGVPIPYSNIGQLIPNILPPNKRELYTDAISANAAQVETYIRKFGLSSQSSTLQEDYARLQLAFHFYQLARTNHSYRAKVNALAQRYLIISGMAVFALAIYLANVPTLLLVTTQYSVLSWLWPSLPVWSVLWSFAARTPTSSNLLAIIISTLGGLSMFLLCLSVKLINHSLSTPTAADSRSRIRRKDREFSNISPCSGWSLCDIGGILMYTLTCLAMFSNSFVINEGYMLGSVLMLVVFLHIVFSSSSTSSSVNENPSATSKEEYLFHVIILRKRLECSLACFLMLGLLVRTCSIFFRCREELQQCSEEYLLHKQLASLPEEWLIHKYVRYSIALLSLAIFVVAFRLWMLYQKCLFTKTPAAIVAKFIPTLLVVLLGVFWALQGLPFISISVAKLKPILNYFPWVFQASTLVSLVLVWLRPIFSSNSIATSGIFFQLSSSSPASCPQCTFRSAKRLRTSTSTFSKSNSPTVGSFSNGALPQSNPYKLSMPVKKQVPINGYTKLANGTTTKDASASTSQSKSSVFVDVDPHPFEDSSYTTADDYSCSILLFTTLVIILMSQITSVGIAPAVSIIIPYMIVALVGIFRTSGQDAWCAAIVWTLMSQYMFYGTGHQPIFSAIPWDSAFLSVTDGQSFTDASDSYLTWLRPAFAVMGNLHVSQIIFSLALPLLAYWSPSGHHLCQQHQHHSCRGRRRIAYLLCGKFILLHGLKLFACMACAGWHRRHLMVWKIFAPKFIFEVISFIVTMFTTVFSLCFVTRIDYPYHRRLQTRNAHNADHPSRCSTAT